MSNNYNSNYTGEHNDGYEARIADLESRLAAVEAQPHVIAHGGTLTSVSGYWKTWSSGLKEWYAQIPFSDLTNYATAFGGSCYYVHVTFPTGLFSAAPNVLYSARCGNGFALTGTQTSSVSATGTNVYLVGTSTGSQSGMFYIYAVGV